MGRRGSLPEICGFFRVAGQGFSDVLVVAGSLNPANLWSSAELARERAFAIALLLLVVVACSGPYGGRLICATARAGLRYRFLAALTRPNDAPARRVARLAQPKAKMNHTRRRFAANMESAFLEHFQHWDVVRQDVRDQFIQPG
jgi:hypothetical protein